MSQPVIISVFQGILNVPIYAAPYNVNIGASGSYTFSGQSDSPMIGEAYNIINNAAGYQTQDLAPMVVSGQAFNLTYGAAYKLTIGPGFQHNQYPFPALETGSGAGLLFGGRFWYAGGAFSWAYDVGFPTVSFSYQGCAECGFYGNSNVAPLIGDYNANVTNNNLQKANSGITGGLGCLSVIEGQQVFTVGSLINLNLGSDCLSVLNGAEGVLISPGLGDSFGDFETSASNMIDKVNNLNYTVGFGTQQYPLIVQWSGTPSAQWAGGTILNQYYVSFDNAAINAALDVDYGSGNNCNGAGINGFMVSVNNTDYYVSKDGTQYWQLNYVSQNGNPVPPPGSLQTKFFDASGIFWWIGANKNEDGSVTPYYSYSQDIPYPLYVLNFPPYSMQCWSQCLGKGNPLTNLF